MTGAGGERRGGSLRIAWLSHGGELAGAELCLLEAARALADRGCELTVIVPRRGALARRLEDELGVPVHVVPLRGWATAHRRPGGRVLRLGRNALSLPAAVHRLRHAAPDVVVTNTLSTPLAAVAARVLGLPHVWYFHEFGEEDHGMRFDWGAPLSYRIVDRLSDLVIANSRAVERKLVAHGLGPKCRLVYYAVDVHGNGARPRSVRAGDPLRLAQVASLSPGKGAADAIRAVRELRDRGVRAMLRLVGRDFTGHRADLERLAAACAVADAVEFCGYQPKPQAFMDWADVVLVCSRSEAFGRATIEAMKRGRPVVGAASGGTSELIRHGETGLLYRPGDPADLAAQIERLAGDAELRVSCARAGSEWARATFSSERYGRELEAVLREAIETHPRRPHDGADEERRATVRGRMRSAGGHVLRGVQRVRNQRTTTVERLGFQFTLDLRDNVQRYLYRNGSYEPELAAFLVSRLRPGDVFADVGAHIGIHTLVCARHLAFAGGGRVIAFEPSALNARRLREAASRAGLDNVTVVETCLGATEGTVELRADPRFGRRDAAVPSAYGPGASVGTYPMTTFDLWAAQARLERLDVVKIDVEGGEHGVLAGMEGSLRDLRPRVVVVEMEDYLLERAGVAPRDLEDILDRCSYERAPEAFGRNVVFRRR